MRQFGGTAYTFLLHMVPMRVFSTKTFLINTAVSFTRNTGILQENIFVNDVLTCSVYFICNKSWDQDDLGQFYSKPSVPDWFGCRFTCPHLLLPRHPLNPGLPLLDQLQREDAPPGVGRTVTVPFVPPVFSHSLHQTFRLAKLQLPQSLALDTIFDYPTPAVCLWTLFSFYLVYAIVQSCCYLLLYRICLLFVEFT